MLPAVDSETVGTPPPEVVHDDLESHVENDLENDLDTDFYDRLEYSYDDNKYVNVTEKLYFKQLTAVLCSNCRNPSFIYKIETRIIGYVFVIEKFIHNVRLFFRDARCDF